MRQILSRDVWVALKRLIPDQISRTHIEKIFTMEWQDARIMYPWISGSKELGGGVNLVGYLKTAKGISEAARSSALALDSAKIRYSIVDYEFGIPASQQVEALPNTPYEQGFQFNTNLIHINPPQLPYLWSVFKKDDLTAHYNIGVWYWELPEFPDEWSFAFDLVDEVWVATQFIFDSVSAKSTVPVVKIPPCVQSVYDYRLNRLDYNLPADSFLFMCAYDVLSIQARKNPLGAVDAFKQAFPKNDSSVGLVIKVNNAAENQQEMEQLQDYVNGHSNCYIIKDVYDKSKFNSLVNLVDVYVSLHRSEGFGLIPAEAMGFGKPVIMTRWSGNLDLMTADNSCGVDFKLVPVGTQSGPYMPGQVWAEPDIDHAAFFMRKLYLDKKYCAHISIQAKKTINDNFSPHLTGQLIKERMRKIKLIS